MASYRQQIVTAIKALLGNVAGVTTVSVWRTGEFEASELPNLNLKDDSASRTKSPYRKWDNELTVTIECNVDASTTGNEQAAIDARELANKTNAAIFADASLGGLVDDLIPVSEDLAVDKNEDTAATFNMEYEIKYQTDRGTI